MDLKSMKLSDEEKSEMYGSVVAEVPDYPYGLQITLGEDQIAALGFQGLPDPGQTMMINARVVVTRMSQSQEPDGDLDRSLSLQITDMAASPDVQMIPTKLYSGG